MQEQEPAWIPARARERVQALEASPEQRLVRARVPELLASAPELLERAPALLVPRLGRPERVQELQARQPVPLVQLPVFPEPPVPGWLPPVQESAAERNASYRRLAARMATAAAAALYNPEASRMASVAPRL